MSRATDWSAKRSTRRAMGFSKVARNFALVPRGLLPARRDAPRGAGPLAAACAHWPVAFWEIALICADLWRVRDTLCMSVVLFINK